MSETTDVPEIAMTNTKKEMLDAYEAVKAALARQQERLLDAEKEREKAKKQLIAATADKAAAQDPVAQLNNLKLTFSRELSGLAEKFEEAIGHYGRIKEAIDAKQKELDTIYGVEAAAADLAALIETKNRKKTEFEENARQTRDAFESETQQARAAWDAEKRRWQEEQDELRKRETVARKREKEDYDYALKREREQRRNALDDEMAALEKEIQTKREAFDRLVAEKEAALSKREEDVTAREKTMDDLRAQVDTFPATLEKAVNRAVQETKNRLEADFAKNEALLLKGFEGEKNVMLSKIEALEAVRDTQTAQIRALSASQEKAYEKVQDIASKAVASSGILPMRFGEAISGRGEKGDAGK